MDARLPTALTAVAAVRHRPSATANWRWYLRMHAVSLPLRPCSPEAAIDATSEIARRPDPAPHASERVGNGDVGDASEQVSQRHRAMCHLIPTVDADDAIVAQNENVPGRYPDFRHIGVDAVRRAGIDIGLLDRHAVDDCAPAFDRD